ncbi:metallophosphoesterase [Mucilaginibacter jinjuensis]|uniref:Metallophosphoesterase n=2 Tax=Mucilaginibacter jinjuensis TaxID=1176721 RepID=A0ABY7TG25_9SPHI|nr:metallophosphoesterase [Mucilaginibacter jinjuensis]WCT15039.1 metallophosphoesterase [Mucilaginibacter jinjuensis]
MRGKNTFACLLLLISICCISISAVAQQTHVIAFASDTQAPLFFEKVIRETNHNKKATEMIFKDILTAHPSALFLLGDVVSLGYSEPTWKNIDRYLKWYDHEAIPVYAVLGNHELLLNAKKGKQEFQSRFPAHSPTGYTKVIDSIAVILLNSNFSEMTRSELNVQDVWYAKTINDLDADPAIKFIIVSCHHSPFSNSTVVGPSLNVQQKFVPAFIKSKKCALFLSGHSHNFERFKVQGKYFLVIGGGGGPHQPLLKEDLTPDLSPKYKPMFHYLEIQRDHDSLQIISRELKSDFSGFDDGLRFYLSKN